MSPEFPHGINSILGDGRAAASSMAGVRDRTRHDSSIELGVMQAFTCWEGVKMIRTCSAVVLAAGAIFLLSTKAAAAPGELAFELEKPNHQAYDVLGSAMVSLGNNILVSAPRDGTAGQYAGAAYLYDGSTGQLLQTFLNPTPSVYEGEYEYFGGRAVAAVNNRVLISDTLDHTDAPFGGSVHMFDATTGDLLRTFYNPTPTINPEDYFGYSISAVDDRVLVGAIFEKDETSAGIAGAAYLFDANTGDLLHTFVSPSPKEFNQFGAAVAEVGDRIFISEPYYDPMEDVGEGRVHVFDATTYELIDSWVNPQPVTVLTSFGLRMAVAGESLLVSGGLSVYKFDPQSGDVLLEVGTEIERLNLNGELVGDGIVMGAVSTVGNDILVGANRDLHEGINAGRVYLFDGDTGELKLTILNPTPDDFEYFGWHVAGLDNGRIVATAPNDDTFGSTAGKTYVFEGVPEPCALLIAAQASVMFWARRRRVRDYTGSSRFSPARRPRLEDRIRE